MPTPQPPINTLGSTPEVPSTPVQRYNLQELVSEFDNLGTSQYIEYHSPQFTTTQKGVETVMPKPQQDLHPYINALSTIYNPSTTMNPSITATTTLTSDISEHTPLFPYYDSDLSLSMLQQLGVKW